MCDIIKIVFDTIQWYHFLDCCLIYLEDQVLIVVLKNKKKQID